MAWPTVSNGNCPVCGAKYPVTLGIPSLMPSTSSCAEVQSYFAGVTAAVAEDMESYAPAKAAHMNAQFRIMRNAAAAVIGRTLPADQFILDVGCGHGSFITPIAERHRVVGVDFTFGMLAIAQRLGLLVVQADAMALPFEDAQFDAVTCWEVLQHFDDLRHPLGEMARVVRPGGKVFVSTLYSGSLLRLLTRAIVKVVRPLEFNLPVIKRSAREVIAGVVDLPLKLDFVAWVHSPASAVTFSPSAWTPQSWMATNFIACFTKTESDVS